MEKWTVVEDGDRIILGDIRELGEWKAFREGGYKIIICDMPWWYADQKKTRRDGKTPTRGIGACHHYTQLTTDELIALPVGSLAQDNCHLYMWATCPLLPDALQIMGSYGFRFSTVAYVWVKLNRARARHKRLDLMAALGRMGLVKFLNWLTRCNPGFYTMSNVEVVLLGTVGKPFRFMGHKGSQVIYHPLMEHSQKPEQVQQDIMEMYPQATPRLELFARRSLAGWDTMGNDPALLSLDKQSGDVVQLL